MSLVAGPGRGGSAESQLPGELNLVIEKHVAYIQALDTVPCEPQIAVCVYVCTWRTLTT